MSLSCGAQANPTLFRSIVVATAIVVAMTTSPSVCAEHSPTRYYIIDQRLPEVFQMLERDTGVQIHITGAVSGRVRRARLDGSVEEVVEQLASEHSLVFFVHGSTIYVSEADKSTMRLVNIDGLSDERISTALTETGLHFSPDDMRLSSNEAILTLKGPPRKLAFAEAVIESLPDDSIAPRSLMRTVRIRRGVESYDEPVGSGRPSVLRPTLADSEGAESANHDDIAVDGDAIAIAGGG